VPCGGEAHDERNEKLEFNNRSNPDGEFDANEHMDASD
jgi:hypothetical protein